MPDYDKIIEHLWEAVCVPHYDNAGNAWEYPKKVQDAANAAIEAIDSLTTPRVMTREEIWTGEIETLWIEVEGKPHIFPGIWYRRSKKDGIPAIDITLNTGIVRGTVVSYGYAWRCWTSKPTDVQRKAVKWGE